MKYYNGKLGSSLIFLIAFLAGIFVFNSNGLKTVDDRFFDALDRFSQILVTGRLIAHDAGVDSQGWSLGSVKINGVLEYTEHNLETYNALVASGAKPEVVYFPYQSHLGLQGAAFLWLHDVFGLNVYGLQFVNATLFALVIAMLTVLFARAYDWKFALAFFIVMVTSPWIVAFARNLYWVPFVWFLPAVFSTLLYLAKTSKGQWLAAIGLLLSMFVKSLTGYEYLSAVTILVCSVFVIGPLFKPVGRSYFSNVKLAALAGVLCVLGFVLALLLHAGMRGDTIAHGLANIIEQDVKKRTYGDASAFDPVLRDSLNASIVDVLKIYWSWLNWRTPVFAGISAFYLNFSMLVVGLGLAYSVARRRWHDLRLVALTAIMLLASLSWYVLAKSHSYGHTQLNYILWYFGFVPALAYTVVFYLVRMGSDAAGFLMHAGVKGKVAVAAVVCLMATGWVVYVKNSDRMLDSRYASATASFDLQSGARLLVSDTAGLTLFRQNCVPSYRPGTYFIHVYPQSPEAISGMTDGFLDVGSKLVFNGNAQLASKYYQSCAAPIQLPAYPLASLEIGETLPDGSIAWKQRIDLGGKTYVDPENALISAH